MEILLPRKWNRRGGPLWIITRMLSHFHDVEFIEYSGQKKGVFLGYNTLPKDVTRHKKIRKVILVGGCSLKDNGVPRATAWDRIHHVVFNSHFCSRVTRSCHKIGDSSVIHILGGSPADEKLCEPDKNRYTIDVDNLNFMVIAKWWKRPFKRLKQTEKLFRDYILPKYPGSKLHVLGMLKENHSRGDIYYYQKTFHRSIVPDIYRSSHMQLMFSTFDTGPMTLTESMHYRVPFVCSNNCCGSELIDLVDGECGISIAIDTPIKSAKSCRKIKPMTNKKFYEKDIDYSKIMQAVDNIVDNYESFVSWDWNNSFNYKEQSNKWMRVLFPHESL